MTDLTLQSDTMEELVLRFTKIGELQSEAIRLDQTKRYNDLFDQLTKIEEELAARPGDGRHSLRTLFGHPNAQVRLNAAKVSLAVLPTEARLVLQSIRDAREQPQALDAATCLRNLERGVFRPA